MRRYVVFCRIIPTNSLIIAKEFFTFTRAARHLAQTMDYEGFCEWYVWRSGVGRIRIDGDDSERKPRPASGVVEGPAIIGRSRGGQSE